MGVAFSLISENVAEAPSAVQIHEMWMHSEGHRANLLDPAIDAAGICVIARNGELYAVEDFARPVPSASLDEQEFAIRALIAQLGKIALATAPDATSAARQTCAMTTGYASASKPTFVMRFTSSSLTQLPSELTTRLALGAAARPASEHVPQRKAHLPRITSRYYFIHKIRIAANAIRPRLRAHHAAYFESKRTVPRIASSRLRTASSSCGVISRTPEASPQNVLMARSKR